MSEKLTGGCSCGVVRYQLTGAPIFVNCCHCTRCQQETGSAFAVNAMIEQDRLQVEKGAPADAQMVTDSGRPHTVFRCPKCATILWNRFGDFPLAFVRVGTLDDPAASPPQAHIFVRSKLPWVVIPEGAPQFETYYKAGELWSAEALARRAAVLGQRT